MSPELELPWLLRIFFNWLDGQPVLGGLIMLMFIDIFVGIFLSIAKRTLSSTVSWRGMSKKAIMLLIIGAVGVLQPFLPAIPLLNLVACFYTLTEALSILENAAAAGVPLPSGLVDTLAKLKDSQRLMREQKSIPPQTPIDPPKPTAT
jgi:toxin secretion/phage lysis holin